VQELVAEGLGFGDNHQGEPFGFGKPKLSRERVLRTPAARKNLLRLFGLRMACEHARRPAMLEMSDPKLISNPTHLQMVSEARLPGALGPLVRRVRFWYGSVPDLAGDWWL
jgi:hypothetical protein